jgi:hypothetical protein
VYSLIFSRAARAELIQAQDWYEDEATGFGTRFREAIDGLTVRMSANPRQFPVVFKNLTKPVSCSRALTFPPWWGGSLPFW